MCVGGVGGGGAGGGGGSGGEKRSKWLRLGPQGAKMKCAAPSPARQRGRCDPGEGRQRCSHGLARLARPQEAAATCENAVSCRCLRERQALGGMSQRVQLPRGCSGRRVGGRRTTKARACKTEAQQCWQVQPAAVSIDRITT